MKTLRSPKYLAWIRQQECVSCGVWPGAGCHAAHVRIGNGGGMGLKPSDYRTVALCAECHGKQHAHGERTFWGDRNPDMPILQNLVDWLDKQGKTKEAIAALEAVAEGL